jgi:two-component system sensor histidine kinase KdpD
MKTSDILGTKKRRAYFQFLGESLAGCWVVAIITFSGYVLHFDSAPVGFLLLLDAVSMAILCGFWQATIVSVLACACLDFFFYPPLLTFRISDARDWVALGAFEISALVVSRLSSREQRSTLEATLHRTSMEQLYELSRSTLLINLHQPPGPQLTQLIHQVFNVEAVALFDSNSGNCDRAGEWAEDETDLAKQCFLLQEEGSDSLTRTSRRQLRIGGVTLGALAIRGQIDPLVADALASLAAITLDRSVSFEKENQIEAAHQTERLRAGVLDSLAHAVKTPLTAIHAANAGLIEVGPLNSAQKELVSLVDSESNELSELCTRLLQTARLEVDEVNVGKEEIVVADMVSSALKKQAAHLDGHQVEVAVPDPNLSIRGDGELLSMALTQFLDNAVKYSFKGTAIKIEARESHSEVLISVHNYGPAIPISDRERIFQRFYRSEGSKQIAAGTGIGLSTVKIAADAHRGHVWVISDADEGTTFFLSLPQNGRRQT